MKEPSFIKINVLSKDYASEVELMFDLEEEVSSFNVRDIYEEIIYFRNRFIYSKKFKFCQIRLNACANKTSKYLKSDTFTFLKNADGVFFIEFLDEKKNLIEKINSEGISCDEQKRKKEYAAIRNYGDTFMIVIGNSK